MNEEVTKFTSFNDFYPFYINEHNNKISRRLHFVGTMSVVLIFLSSVISGKYLLLLLMPVAGYGFAWIGHFFFEKNKPATFKYPFYSLMGDFVMFRDILVGKIKI